MRWEALFADLEAQWEAAEAAELALEIADRSRREAGYLRLVDRLRPAVGYRVRVDLAGSMGPERGAVDGRLLALGVDWLLLEDAGGVEALVPARSVLAVRGLLGESAPPGHEGRVGARLDLRHALRGVARDRSGCLVTLSDGRTVSGTVDRVGADFVDLAEHAPGEFRRPRDVALCTIPLAAVAVLRRAA
ncbi:hypothetical protein I6A84_29450 [Frankia sp. CNm7]|uniref:Fis family transcriptional regulator n=1 Tax=Frankia nepalensis TaxID=1836974 RepID=A0A937UJZ6_9ACTN|nr:hypothetical protein [Frankia nepalensis]MBL7495229.1 hypothetical protein [Frankia nepalensis]MBL7515427.1 hypothetical protein [Frankia nepalensis]MBL7522091.1 hypothetical protein [Frankia nepalensis]MBL7626294.1 hypothetical protein [Frankia nepalensis]